MVLAGAAAGYGGDRRRPVTGGAVRGSRRAVGLPSEGRGEKLPPRNGETPGEPRLPTAGHLGRSIPLNCSRPSSLFTARAPGRSAASPTGPRPLSNPCTRRCCHRPPLHAGDGPAHRSILAPGPTGASGLHRSKRLGRVKDQARLIRQGSSEARHAEARRGSDSPRLSRADSSGRFDVHSGHGQGRGSRGSRCCTGCRRDLWVLGVSQSAPSRAIM